MRHEARGAVVAVVVAVVHAAVAAATVPLLLMLVPLRRKKSLHRPQLDLLRLMRAIALSLLFKPLVIVFGLLPTKWIVTIQLRRIVTSVTGTELMLFSMPQVMLGTEELTMLVNMVHVLAVTKANTT